MRYSMFSNERLFSEHVESVGFSSDPTVTKYGPGKRECYIIHYCYSGRGYFNGNAVAKGQGFLIRPGDFEHYYPDTTDPWSFLWIIGYGGGFDRIFERYSADEKTRIFSYGFPEKMQRFCDIIKTSAKKQNTAAELTELFSSILKCHGNTVYTNAAQSYVEYAREYIYANIHTRLTVGEITARLGVSQSYLYKIFVEELGISAKKFIDRARMERARELLLTAPLSVSEVGSAVGFSDVLEFSAFFSHNEGVSPSKFRKNQLTKPDINGKILS